MRVQGYGSAVPGIALVVLLMFFALCRPQCPHESVALHQSWANFFSKVADSKYFSFLWAIQPLPVYQLFNSGMDHM